MEVTLSEPSSVSTLNNNNNMGTESKDTLCSLPSLDKLKHDPFLDRHRFDSESSTDSGFEGLEHLEPLEIDDLQPFSSMDCRYTTVWCFCSGHHPESIQI
jgi:hypothetical protein